MKTSHYII